MKLVDMYNSRLSQIQEEAASREAQVAMERLAEERKKDELKLLIAIIQGKLQELIHELAEIYPEIKESRIIVFETNLSYDEIQIQVVWNLNFSAEWREHWSGAGGPDSDPHYHGTDEIVHFSYRAFGIGVLSDGRIIYSDGEHSRVFDSSQSCGNLAYYNDTLHCFILGKDINSMNWYESLKAIIVDRVIDNSFPELSRSTRRSTKLGSIQYLRDPHHPEDNSVYGLLDAKIQYPCDPNQLPELVGMEEAFEYCKENLRIGHLWHADFKSHKIKVGSVNNLV